MSFAQEVRDFTGAFTAVSNALGTVSSREADQLDNEYRRAQIDYTRANTADKLGSGMDLTDWLAGGGGYHGTPLNTSVDGAPATEGATAALDVGAGGAGIPWSGDTPSVPSPRARPAAVATGVPTPPPRPARTAALTDDDISGGAGAGVRMGARGADTVAARPYSVNIRDKTSWSGMQPRALRIMDTINGTANQMGIRLVVTAGAGGGHLSHGQGTEADLVGYHADGSMWTTAERAKIAASGGSVGANRFGLYPGMSLHIGYSGPDRPSAVWGNHGFTSGGSSRQFSDPADVAFLQMFQSGKLFGSDGGSFAQAFATTGASPMARYRNAIAAIESRGSGDYAATNGNALGRYQVMASNLPSWSKAALGRVVTPQEFLANPAIQDQIFDHQFGGLLQKYGNPQDAASAWFTGRPLAGGGAGASDDNITGAQYVARFNKAYGSAGYETGGGGGGGGDVARAGAGGESLMGDYPTQEAVSSTDPAAVAAAAGPEDYTGTTRSAVPAGTPQDIIHTVVKHDTLGKLAKKYNLDSYLPIYEANRDIIGDDPNVLKPGQELRIPGVPDPAAAIPNPQPRPDHAVPVNDTYQTPTVQSDLTPEQMAKVDQLRAQQVLDAGPHLRPAVGDEPAVAPTTSTSTRTVRSDLTPAQMAEVKRRVAEQASMPPDPRLRPEHMPDAEIAAITSPTIGYMGTPETQMSIDQSGAVPITPTARSDLTSGQLDAVRQREGIGPFPPRPGAVGEDLSAAVPGQEPVALTGAGAVDALDRAGLGKDQLTSGGMTPAEQSIADVSQWNITPNGHMVHPDGKVSPVDTFTRGRQAALAGRGWLAKMLGLDTPDQAVDAGDAATPDDGTPDAASAMLSGKFAFKESEMAQIHKVIDDWAAKNGIKLTESERNIRSVGLLGDFYLAQGDAEKYQAMSAAALSYYQLRYNQYSAIGKAAAEAGDTSTAVRAAVRAYSQIPDGRDITVSGNDATGWKVRYTDEATGKVINEKVLSPQEMYGMIMNMSPGDVDKFLVKAAGQDALPEASPELVKLLADLDATPPDQRPVFNARLAAELPPRDYQIYADSFHQSTAVWNENTGGAAGARQRATVDQVLGPPEAATTAAPATSTPATPAGGGAVPIDETPAAPGAKYKPGDKVIYFGDEYTLKGGDSTHGWILNTPEGVDMKVYDKSLTPAPTTPVTSEVKLSDGEVAPGVFAPGDDKTYGLGPSPKERLREGLSADDPSLGLQIVGELQKQDLAEYNQKLETRKSVYAEWLYQQTLKSPGAVPAGVGPPTAEESGGGQGVFDEGDIVRRQREQPFLDARLKPPLPPGRAENFGAGPKPDVNTVIEQMRKQGENTANANAINLRFTAAEKDWNDKREQGKADLTAAIEAITPVKRRTPPDDYKTLHDNLETYITNAEGSDLPSKLAAGKQLRNQQYLVEEIGNDLMSRNNMQPDAAIDTATQLLLVNPAMPSLPAWRAWEHPGDPGIMLVQLLSDMGGPHGVVLHIPQTLFAPMVQAWKEASDQAIGTAEAGYGKSKVEPVLGIGERILGDLEQEARNMLPSGIINNKDVGPLGLKFDPDKLGNNLGDLFDWYTHGVFSNELTPAEQQKRLDEYHKGPAVPVGN